MADDDRGLNAREAARLLGAHVETVRRLARKGDIPAFKLAKDWRFNGAELRRWAETHHERSRSASILVVDDEEVVCDILRRVLEGDGYDVSCACDGAEALELMRREVPDLVTLDLRMPGMSGPAVLKAIREAHGALPVIIITGYPDSELMADALDYGPILLVRKPIESHDVLQSVRLALNGWKRQKRDTRARRT